MQMTQSNGFASTGLGPLDGGGWVATVSPGFRDWLAANGRWRRYPEGAIIHAAGDAPFGLFGLGRGAFETALPLGGDEPVTVFRAGPGDWFGEACVLDAPACQNTVSAARDSEVYCVPAAALRLHLGRTPAHWAALLGLSQINAAFAVSLLAEALALRPRARVARMLLRLADDAGRVHARQDDLARLIGMTRSSLQRAMRRLTESGAMQAGYGQLTIADRAALTRIAEGD